MKRAFFASLTILCLLSVSSVTGLIHLAKADVGTIYIQADGSIDPSTAPIYTADNITYTLTGSITANLDGIVIERDNITVDGTGYNMTGGGSGTGIALSGRSNVTIENMTIGAFEVGIWLWSSSNNSISGNNITGATHTGILVDHSSNYNSISGNNVTNNTVGIYLDSSSSNSVSGNNITANGNLGITLKFSSNNIISGNNITNSYFGIFCILSSDYNTLIGNTVANNGFGINGVGIYLESSNDTIYHNNFINNTNQFYSSGSPNAWDNGFEGNHWSDYNETDNNQDGIGDTSYIIDENNTDHYPLMGTFQSFNVSTWSHPNDGFEEVDVISNFAISNLGLYGWLTTPNQYLQAGQIFLSLTPVQGQNMTARFCRITVPNNVLNTSDYTVLINMTPISVNKLALSNNTQTTLYFTFNTSPNEIIIVPELPSFLILPLFFMTTLLAVILFRKRRTKYV